MIEPGVLEALIAGTYVEPTKTAVISDLSAVLDADSDSDDDDGEVPETKTITPAKKATLETLSSSEGKKTEGTSPDEKGTNGDGDSVDEIGSRTGDELEVGSGVTLESSLKRRKSHNPITARPDGDDDADDDDDDGGAPSSSA